MSDQKDNKIVQWLDQLQEQSWNLELIISGFVLFGLFQLRDFLTLQLYYFNANGTAFYDKFTLSFIALEISIDIFILSLLLLIFTRGLWIGAIGLRYVSGEIDYDTFKYNDKFKGYLKRKVGDFDDYIQRLEHISSSIFAFTYLLFFMFLSLVAIDLQFQLLFYLSEKFDFYGLANVVSTVFFIVGFIVLFDFITLGLLKRIQFRPFSAVYMPIYRFYGVVTLSFLWRPIWYNFIDQHSTKWIAALTVPLLLGFIFLNDVPFTVFKYQFFPQIQHRTDLVIDNTFISTENMRTSFQAEFYDDLREAERAEKKYAVIRKLSLPSHRIEIPLMEVFVKYDQTMDDFIKREDSLMMAINEVGFNVLDDRKVFDTKVFKQTKSEYEKGQDKRYAAYREQTDSLWSTDRAKASNRYEEYASNEFQLYRTYSEDLKSLVKQSFSFAINEQPIPDSTIELAFHIHPNFGEKGLLCLFSMQHATLGMNYLTLKRRYYNYNTAAYLERDYTIPFIYTGEIIKR
ncbi:MAG: hypothetical protein AAGI23_21810 [Bacteroidota bacterium]